MVVSGLLVGLSVGNFLPSPTVIATVALITALTLALTEIRLTGISLRGEIRPFAVAFVWNYVVLSGLVLTFAFLTPDPDLRAGWVVMAAVPSAIAVVPLASILRGQVRSSVVSSAILYALSLGLVPAITLAFAGRAVPLPTLAVQTFLQIGLPLLASRVLGAAVLRTFGIGLGIAALATLTHRRHDQRVTWTLFGSFKNLGLTALLALSVFDTRAAIPAIVCLLFEILWLASLPLWLKGKWL